MKMKSVSSIFLLLGALLAGCAVAQTAVITPEPPVTAPPVATPSEFSRALLESLDPADILLQRDFEPGLLRPEVFYPFGRVASFTLYADGTLIYLDEGESYDQQQLLTVQLSQDQTLALVQQMLDLGFERLESNTDECQTQADGTSLCVMDAGTSILRVRLPSGELREVKNYHDYANEPQVLVQARSLLDDYVHPSAQLYPVERATLFVARIDKPVGVELEDWPLDPNWLENVVVHTFRVRALSGADLEAVLELMPRNMGDFYIESGGQYYNGFLVPWLPEADYTQAIEAEFPAPTRGAEDPRPAVSKFSLAYAADGDLWFMESGEEPQVLLENGDIRQVRLSPDGHIVVFTRVTTEGNTALWAINADGNNPRQLAGPPQVSGSLDIHAFSDAAPLVAFSHQVDGLNAELWVARLDGTEARMLVSAAELLSLVDPEIKADGAVPTAVQWVPKTNLLTYDAFPQFARDGIYIFVQDQVAVVDVNTGQQAFMFAEGEGGMISYSPDGTEMVIITPDSLDLMNVEARNRHAAGVEYFAIGFGEHYVYPPLAWYPDSRSLLLAQPSSEDIQTDVPFTIWRIPIDGSPAEKLGDFSGFVPSITLSPDLSKVAFWRAEPQSNDRELYIANTDGSGQVMVADGGLVEFLNWAPDSEHFVYWYAEEARPLYADLHGTINPLGEALHATYPTWLDPNHFLYPAETPSGQGLFLGSTAGPSTLLGVMEGIGTYDFVISKTPGAAG